MPLQNIDEAIGTLIELGYVVIDHRKGTWNLPKWIELDKTEINGMLRMLRELNYAQVNPDYSAILVDGDGKITYPSVFLTDEQSIVSFASSQAKKYPSMNETYLL
jgi:hypothetical protein